MAGLIIAIGIGFVLYKLISEACETPYDSGSLGTSSEARRRHRIDTTAVTTGSMSKKEYEGNIRAGKYRD